MRKETMEKECNEDCQLFRWHKCQMDREDGLCNKQHRYDNALNEFGDGQ